MKPDRSNYEIWFTDLLDGNLSDKQIEELKVFLSENPDLNEELNGLSILTINPPDFNFCGKKDLSKSSDSLSEEQFEHLCIASLENDLTPGQKAELIEIISRNESRRKSFERFQKLKLKPFPVSFTRKSSVKKLTIGQKIFRLSVIGLSAAATIAIIVSVFLLVPGNSKSGSHLIVQDITSDTLLLETHQAIIYKETEAKVDYKSINTIIRKSIPEISVSEATISLAEKIDQEMTDSASLFKRAEVLAILKMAIPENNITAFRPQANTILAFNPGYIPPLIDYRSNVQIFLAKIFHEKIMKDPNSGTRPVESYDLAQAGITGLNKLFGWEIALHKNTDENGDIRSYNFSSRLLKFNAPVKKSVKAL